MEVLAKPGGPYSVGELRLVLANKIRAAAAARIRTGPARPADSPRPVQMLARPPLAAPAAWDPGLIVAVGASTGGTEAIADVMVNLPQQFPPDRGNAAHSREFFARFRRAFEPHLPDGGTGGR